MPARGRAQQPPAEGAKPFVAFSGGDSRIETVRYERIVSDHSWAEVWLGNFGKRPSGKYDFFRNPERVPDVDFEKCMVIAVFGGKTTNRAGFKAVGITESAEQVTFRFCPKSFQTGGQSDRGHTTTPYAFFVVPRSTKPVVLEVDAHQYLGDQPAWKEVHRFPAQAGPE